MKTAFFVLLLVAISLVSAWHGRYGRLRNRVWRWDYHFDMGIIRSINSRCFTDFGCCYPQKKDDKDACSKGCPFRLPVIDEINRRCGTDFGRQQLPINKTDEWWDNTCYCVVILRAEHKRGGSVISR